MNLGLPPLQASCTARGQGLPSSLSPRPFYSLAGAVYEFPGPKEGLALCWSQGARGSQNPHEILRKNTGI